jgi:hypothetical protein
VKEGEFVLLAGINKNDAGSCASWNVYTILVSVVVR